MGIRTSHIQHNFQVNIQSPQQSGRCLSLLVELPQDRPATINMLSATNFDGPTFNTGSRTVQHSSSEDTTSQTDAIAPDVTDTQITTSKSLTADRLGALLQMQKMDRFCKHISK